MTPTDKDPNDKIEQAAEASKEEAESVIDRASELASRAAAKAAEEVRKAGEEAVKAGKRILKLMEMGRQVPDPGSHLLLGVLWVSRGTRWR